MYELCFIVKVVFCVGVIFMLLKKPCSLVHVCLFFGFFFLYHQISVDYKVFCLCLERNCLAV